MLGVVFFSEIIAGITGYVLSDETTQVLSSKLNDSMVKYNKTIDITTLWDEVQIDVSTFAPVIFHINVILFRLRSRGCNSRFIFHSFTEMYNKLSR